MLCCASLSLSLCVVWQEVLPVFLFLFYSFWVPQIAHCAHRDTPSGLSHLYILGTSCARLFMPLYFLACPYNFVNLLEPYAPAYGFALALCGWMGAQVRAPAPFASVLCTRGRAAAQAVGARMVSWGLSCPGRVLGPCPVPRPSAPVWFSCSSVGVVWMHARALPCAGGCAVPAAAPWPTILYPRAIPAREV